MSEQVTLKINSKVYSGWLGFSVTLGIESLTNQFRLTLTDNWVDQEQPWPIVPGDKCEITLGSEKLITGYIDEVSPSFDAASKSLSVSGRDMAGDLVDCSVEKSELVNVTLDKAATVLCSPFGITVKRMAPVGAAFPRISINPGESVFEVLDKRARSRGVLLVSNANGQVEIIRPGSTRAPTALVEGENIKAASARFDAKDRYSKYVVKSQLGATDEEGLAALAVTGTATDSGVKRYRPLVMQAEAQAETGSAKARAQFEATVRASRSATMQVTVVGFRQHTGALWKPNSLVSIEAPSIGVRERVDMLISQVTFSLDGDGGSVTQLDLKRKDAFLSVEKLTEKNDPYRALYLKEGGI